LRKYGYLAENADFIVADGKNEEEAKVSRIRDGTISEPTHLQELQKSKVI